MLKGLTTKTFLTCFALFCATQIYALEITNFESEEGKASISFCDTFKIKNITKQNTKFGQIIILPKESSGYTNLTFLTREIANKTLSCFSSFNINICKNAPSYFLVSARKVGKGNSVLAEVSFDKELKVVFFLSLRKNNNKIFYTLTAPQDFKFIDKNYKKELKDWLIKECQKNEMF